jgi:hypothetical protein
LVCHGFLPPDLGLGHGERSVGRLLRSVIVIVIVIAGVHVSDNPVSVRGERPAPGRHRGLDPVQQR